MSEPTSKLLAQLRHHFLQANEVIVQREEASIVELEGRYGCRFPNAFREYLLTSCPGTETFEYGICWWEFSRIGSLHENHPGPTRNNAVDAERHSYLYFADYLIGCNHWAINCGQGPDRGRVIFVGDRTFFVASKFNEFVASYLANDDDIF